MPTDDRAPDDGYATAIGLHHAMEAARTGPSDGRPGREAQSIPTYGPPPEPDEPVVLEDPIVEAPAATDEPPDDDDESIQAIRARLAARGLLVQGPTIVVPREPRAEKPVVLDDVLAEAEGDLHPNAVPEDDWDIASEGGAVVSVRCPQCRGTQLTAIDVTRFRCFTCERAWRWAVCQACGTLGFTVERQETWRCGCGNSNRSWWRTDVAPREALIVVARRKDVAAQAERAEVRAGMRRRRWLIILGGAVGLLAVLVFVVIVRAGEATPAAGTAETCRQAERLSSDLGNGTLDADELAKSLAKLRDAAGVAEAAVHDAATELAGVGTPSTAAFLIAQTELADACDAFEARR